MTASPLHIRKGCTMRLHTEAAICRDLGLSKTALRAYIKSGIIKEGKTDKGLFVLETTAREIIAAERNKDQKPPDYTTERAKLMRAKRKNEEYELRVKQGELHRTEDIEEVAARILVGFKSRITAIPSRAAPQVAKMDDTTEIFDFLKKLTDEALEELSNFDTVINGGSEELGDDE